MSTPMVQANLAFLKTMTRRLKALENINKTPDDWSFGNLVVNHKGELHVRFIHKEGQEEFIKCPYGRPGDLLWVRETWAPDLAGNDINDYVEYIRYAADGARLPIKWVKDYSRYNNRPGIHMNKEYARIWLQVTDVRVERLQDISEEDAKAEGVEKQQGSSSATRFYYRHYKYPQSYDVDAKVSFRTLWESINGADSWGIDPWVWVITFEVLSTTGKPAPHPISKNS